MRYTQSVVDVKNLHSRTDLDFVILFKDEFLTSDEDYSPNLNDAEVFGTFAAAADRLPNPDTHEIRIAF